MPPILDRCRQRIVAELTKVPGRKAPLAAAALSLVLMLSFALLADAMTEGDTMRLDRLGLLAFRSATDATIPLGPLWLQEAVRDCTALGSTTFLTLLVAGIVVFLLLTRRYSAAILVLTATLGGAALSSLMKAGFARARPDIVPNVAGTYLNSFPSGHTLMATVVYLTLGGLLATSSRSTYLRLYFFSTAVALAALVGVSRLYLGVHWPTDVLGGWVIGVAWATLCLLVWHLLWCDADANLRQLREIPAGARARPAMILPNKGDRA